MENSQIAEVFENIASLLEMRTDSVFIIRAYQKAARIIERLPTELATMIQQEQDLLTTPGIGKAISNKIKEMVETGKLEYYETLKSEFPRGILEVVHIRGMGPKTTKMVWKKLGATTLSDLERVILDGSLAGLPRMGEKTAKNILQQIKFTQAQGERMPIAKALPISERVIDLLSKKCQSIARLVAVGSLRRFEETIGDIDLVCATTNPQEVLDTFVNLPNVTEVLHHTDIKASVILTEGIQAGLRIIEDSRFGSVLQYSTGSQQHNLRLGDYASRIGISLNEYRIVSPDTGEIQEFADENGFYDRLGLQYIPPEIRSGMQEINAAQESRIPVLIEVADMKGDLHVHTNWSDGRDSMEVMIAGASERGLQYIAITDHSMGRGIANGLSPKRLRKHMDNLKQINTTNLIRVIPGTEMDIRADGSLDYPDKLLKELSWVIASIHSSMNQEASTMTERIIRAMRNPYVSIIGHLTTRLIGDRQPINADFEALFKAAADTGTALEINASPERLDLKDTHIYRARELGVPLAISSDAHTVEGLDNLRYGAMIARRGWCEAKHILNTMSAREFLSFLELKKPQRAKVIAKRG